MFENVSVVGGAGFIGSHIVDELLASKETKRLIVFDNFSSGREWHLEHHYADKRLEIVRGEISDRQHLTEAINGTETVIHLASNPDISLAVNDPEIDFRQGTSLTNHVLEATRVAGAKIFLYASGSGVYGDRGWHTSVEDQTPLEPNSTYGASKLAGEALLSAYCRLFNIRGYAFRFANVVGARQTHGVGYDFIKKLIRDKTRLSILGDGTQSKSYIHVTDVVRALIHVAKNETSVFRVFNVSTNDHMTVTEIARAAIDVMSLEPESVRLEYAGGSKGWQGDVPVVRLDASRLRSMGWNNQRDTKEALCASLVELLPDALSGKI